MGSGGMTTWRGHGFTNAELTLRPLQRIVFSLLTLLLVACSASPLRASDRDYFPGGVPWYSAGPAAQKEYFAAHVSKMQSDYGLFKQRVWRNSSGNGNPASMNILQAYYPLHVRWQLKDGRQFIAENIDIRSLMREWFKTNDIKMQWQQENRERVAGDYGPSLAYEVRDDEVIVKWLLSINHTPLVRRATELPQIEYVDYPVARIKGTPVTGIDFSIEREPAKDNNERIIK